jgi:hypothetical protein
MIGGNLMYDPALEKPSQRRINYSMVKDEVMVPINSIFSERSKVSLLKNQLNTSNGFVRSQTQQITEADNPTQAEGKKFVQRPKTAMVKLY